MSDNVLWEYGQPHADLAALIERETAAGGAVMWASVSGTRLVYANASTGELTRHRYSTAILPADGLPVLVEQPWFATPCGCGDAGGYRSTPPIAVVAVRPGDDVTEVAALLAERVRTLMAQILEAGEWQAAVGHPEVACVGMNCPKSADDE